MYESSMFHGHKTNIVFIWLYSWTVLFALALFVDGVSTLLPVCQSTVATKLMFIC